MARRKKALNAKDLAAAYPLKGVLELSLTHRAAHCLDWCRRAYPYVHIPWNWLWRAISGGTSTPRMDNDFVVGLRRNAARIRKILLEQYGCAMATSVALEGVRACVDSNDAYASGEIDRASRRVVSASNSLLAHYETIQPDTLTAENRERHDQLGPATVKLASPAITRRLLPPPKEEE